MNLKRLFYCMSVSAALLVFPFSSWTQALTSDAAPTIFQYIVEKGVTHMTITTDFTTLTTERNEDHSPHATLTMEGPNYFRETMKIKVELRGRNRRLVCDMPPLKLDFSKKRLAERGIGEDGDKLKLVTHCADEYQEEYLLREYWAYRLYNELTPASFRVHLIKIRYIDTADPNVKNREQMAFILESKEELAKRLGGEDEDFWGLKPEEVDKESYYNTVLFQYMIGNDDWGMESPHNLAFVKLPDDAPPIIVPYDFDFSGLVNAPYAKPNPKYGGFSVLDRIPIGSFESRDDLEATLDGFQQTRATGLKCFEECAWLSDRSKKRMEKYLEGFFRQVENQKKIERLFLDGK